MYVFEVPLGLGLCTGLSFMALIEPPPQEQAMSKSTKHETNSMPLFSLFLSPITNKPAKPKPGINMA